MRTSEAAAQIVALINSSPRSPRTEEIEAIITPAMQGPYATLPPLSAPEVPPATCRGACLRGDGRNRGRGERCRLYRPAGAYHRAGARDLDQACHNARRRAAA